MLTVPKSIAFPDVGVSRPVGSFPGGTVHGADADKQVRRSGNCEALAFMRRKNRQDKATGPEDGQSGEAKREKEHIVAGERKDGSFKEAPAKFLATRDEKHKQSSFEKERGQDNETGDRKTREHIIAIRSKG